MTDLHFTWIEGAICCPFIGALVVFWMRDSHLARRWCLVFSALALFCATCCWLDFEYSHAPEADDRWHLLTQVFGREVFVIDQVSAPLLPMVALLYFLTQIATVRTKIERFPFALSLISESVLLAVFSCKIPEVVVALMALGAVFPFLELRSRGRATRAYCLYVGLYISLMLAGQYWSDLMGTEAGASDLPAVLLALAMCVRTGIVPFHSWIPDLFDRATFGMALLFVTPMTGAYGLVRLVVPIAPAWLLNDLAMLAIVSALYMAAMALVQRDARRFFSYLVLSKGAMVMAGLLTMTHHGLTGGLCVWLSFAVALGGLGLTLRALEARRGRLSMQSFLGLYDHTPNLAMCFGLTALATVGFPGTFGFVGTELLVDATVETHPYIGIIIVLATALNGITVVKAFFRIFGGPPYLTSVSFQIRVRERYAVLALAAVVFTGGLFPQPLVLSRSEAAEEILEHRENSGAVNETDTIAAHAPVPVPAE